MGEPKKPAVYVRWSHDEAEKGTTLEVQKEACLRYLASQGWTFDESLFYVDDGYSGGSLDRPALKRLRNDIEKGLIDCVVVYRVDRLSRNLDDAAPLVNREWMNRVVLRSATEDVRPEVDEGWLNFTFRTTFADYERRIIRQRTMSGKLRSASEGKFVGSTPPFGYRLEPIVINGRVQTKNGKPMRGLVPDESQADLVRYIFDRYNNGTGLKNLAAELNQKQIPTATGREWSTTAIAVILDNPVYIGKLHYNENIFGGLQEPLISEEIWETTRRLRTERARFHPRELASRFSLTGILRCGECGSKMFGTSSKWRRKSGEQVHRLYYVCYRVQNAMTCHNRAYHVVRDVEERFVSEIERFIDDTEILRVLESRNSSFAQRQKQEEANKRAAEEGLANLRNALKRLDRAYFEVGTITDEEYVQKKAEYQHRERSLLEAINLPSPEEEPYDVEGLVRIARDIRSLWFSEDSTPQERKHFAMNLLNGYGLSVLVYYDGTLKVTSTITEETSQQTAIS